MTLLTSIFFAVFSLFICFSSNAESLEIFSDKKQKICADVGYVLFKFYNPKNRLYEDPLYVRSIDLGGRSYAYQDIDLDKDGRPDDVIQDCGSPSDGTCTLHVNLSSRGGYQFDENVFSVINFRSRFYVLVGNTYPQKNNHRRLYELTTHGAKIVCKSF